MKTIWEAALIGGLFLPLYALFGAMLCRRLYREHIERDNVWLGLSFLIWPVIYLVIVWLWILSFIGKRVTQDLR
jgi:uncharacterized membrane protein